MAWEYCQSMTVSQKILNTDALRAFHSAPQGTPGVSASGTLVRPFSCGVRPSRREPLPVAPRALGQSRSCQPSPPVEDDHKVCSLYLSHSHGQSRRLSSRKVPWEKKGNLSEMLCCLREGNKVSSWGAHSG